MRMASLRHNIALDEKFLMFCLFYVFQKVLKEDLGPDWASKMKEFEKKPFAAASIGQVHRAVTLDGRPIALKIQVLAAVVCSSNYMLKETLLETVG